MTATNYESPAELFPSLRYAKSLARYRRFESPAEAVCYVIEDMAESWPIGTTLDVDGTRYEGWAIRVLYDADPFPLKRATALA